MHYIGLVGMFFFRFCTVAIESTGSGFYFASNRKKPRTCKAQIQDVWCRHSDTSTKNYLSQGRTTHREIHTRNTHTLSQTHTHAILFSKSVQVRVFFKPDNLTFSSLLWLSKPMRRQYLSYYAHKVMHFQVKPPAPCPNLLCCNSMCSCCP